MVLLGDSLRARIEGIQPKEGYSWGNYGATETSAGFGPEKPSNGLQIRYQL
jgi:hypothetical protein